MLSRLRRHAFLAAGGLLVALAGSALLVASELGRQREAFDTQARIVHRLLSQRAAENDAVLATLALLQPSPAEHAIDRLQAIYPQLVAIQQRSAARDWTLPSLAIAEERSRTARRAVMADAQLAGGRYWLVQAAEPASFALRIDLAALAPGPEWPLRRDTGDTHVDLSLGDQRYVVQQAASAQGWGTRLAASKALAVESQPLVVTLSRRVTPAQWPWVWIALWWLGTGGFLAAFAAWRAQRRARARAEELLRLGQVGRLNALGELAAGLAHELNQPLTAVLANTQAAGRLLDDDPPDIVDARAAMSQAAQQARRASDVVRRLRRGLERTDPGAPQPVSLQDAVRSAFELLEPEFARRGVVPRFHAQAEVRVRAEPVALEQILHNLLMNALQALEQVPPGERSLWVALSQESGCGVLTVRDSGPGVPPELLPRLFEPFVSTRTGGLGLGLPLCESLASAMGGSIAAQPIPQRGASFRLTLPALP
ncbi:ATP-binding protein [Ramlibacter tataouinensis]|uniref:sensor histidine kinase n=1 Tax=Ramlibacter tataouinensis TaxID=94132 RepID=UPI0022F3D01A|nr:ATP-binding protein [Ramlibacter tataouinensis]WBY01234.1 ATP-binding protein [Ramlibacter tataouinensis]